MNNNMISRILAWPFLLSAVIMLIIAWFISGHEEESIDSYITRTLKL